MDDRRKIALAEELLRNWADGLLGDRSALDALAATFLTQPQAADSIPESMSGLPTGYRAPWR